MQGLFVVMVGVVCTMPSKSDYEIRQEGYMSQNLAAVDGMFQKLFGADQEISDSLGILYVLGEKGLLDLKDSGIDLMISLIDVLRKSHLATSPQNSNITTLGFGLPRVQKAYDGKKDGE